MSYSTALYFLLLMANTSYHVSAVYEDDSRRYCRLCQRHTMCLFHFDDPSPRCRNLESGDLDDSEIQSIVHEHNLHRNYIASGQETRGKPGPQPPARNMMELSWDEELATLARRWALQCVPLQKDECRDVERFSVWQNIHVWPMHVVETGTSSHHRIPFHIQSWLDDVENFDTAEVGMVDFSVENRGGYIGIATGMITRVGCGRALYTVESWYHHHHQGMGNSQSSSSSSMVNGLKMQGVNNNSTVPSANVHSTDTANQLEVLVCNYGPIDRTTPGNLYEDGMPTNCPMGFYTSPRYEHLCSETDEQDEEQWEASVRSASMGQHSATSLLLFALHRSLVDLLSER